ncbi:uncharacterized protein LOC134721808 [Mytilus trossulus]|uniref:uncharacterized protein LOC134721808 n=1 Tax=Mytilus trossulus TaxID=6551 RepID=UPI0030077395
MQGKVTKKTRQCKQCKGPCKGHPCENDEPPDETEKQSENEHASADQSMGVLGNGLLTKKDDFPEEIFKLATKEQMYQLGMDPICIVAAMGHLDGMRKFVEAGTNSNDKRSTDGSTPLMLATQNKHLEVVELLLKHSADVTAVNKENSNAFMVAIRTGDAKLVNTIWPYRGNLDINHQNNLGNTALHIATDKCWDACVQFLLSSGANIDEQNNDGYTPLMVASLKGDMKILNRLLSSGADLLKEDIQGCTALCLSAESDHDTVLDTLLDKISDLNLKENFVKNRLDRIKSPMGEEDLEELLLAVLYVFQKLTALDEYRDVLYKLKTLPSVMSVVQKHLKMKDVTLLMVHIACKCMFHRDPDFIDDRFVQQYIKSRGFELCLKALKLHSDTNRKNYELLISCFFPIICASQISDGKTWIEKNHSKIACYSHLRDQFTKKMCVEFEGAREIWNKFWESFNDIQKQHRDKKMAELLEEEERERNKKIKKRERKKQRRNKLQEVKTKGDGDSEKINCDEKGEENIEQVKEKTRVILRSKLMDIEMNRYVEKIKDFYHTDKNENLKYENVTENARTSKSRRYAKSKNFLDEVSAQSVYGTSETQLETRNDKWVTVQNKKANLRPETFETDSQVGHPGRKNFQSVTIDQQKSGKRWADVASNQIIPKHSIEEPVNSLANDCEISATAHCSFKEKHKYKRGDYEDDFPSLDPNTSPKRNSPIEQRRKSNDSISPMLDEWYLEECPDEWTARSTSSTPTELERYSYQSGGNIDDNKTLDLHVGNTPGISYQHSSDRTQSTESFQNTGEIHRDANALSNTCIDFGFATTDDKEKAIECALDTAKYTFSKAQMTYWQDKEFVPLLYENKDEQAKIQVGKTSPNVVTTITKTVNLKSDIGKSTYTAQPQQQELISNIKPGNNEQKNINTETKTAKLCNPNLTNFSYMKNAQPVVDEAYNRQSNTDYAHRYIHPTNHIQTEPVSGNFGESDAVKNWLRNDSMMSKTEPHMVDNSKFIGGLPSSVFLDNMKYSNNIDTLPPNCSIPSQHIEPPPNILSKPSESNVKKGEHTKATETNTTASNVITTNNTLKPNAAPFFIRFDSNVMHNTQKEIISDQLCFDSDNQHLQETSENNLNCTRQDSCKSLRNCLNRQVNTNETDNSYLSSTNFRRAEIKSKMEEFKVNSIAVVKPLGALIKRGNHENPLMTSNNTCSEQNCDLGESILRNVANLDIADEGVWYPSRLRGEPEEQQPRHEFSYNQTNVFPGFHDISSTADNDRDTVDFGFSEMKKLASYQWQKQYNEVRKRGPVYGSLYYHDIPYYASCLGISEHELERSFVSDLKTTFQHTNEQQTVDDIVQLNENTVNVTNEDAATGRIAASNLQEDNIPDLYDFTPGTRPAASHPVIARSGNEEPHPYLLSEEYDTEINTMNHIKKPVYEPTFCEKYRYQLAQQIQNIQTKNHMQSTSTDNRSPSIVQTGVQDNGVCPPHKYAQSNNTIQPWIQRSIRWRQKLMEIRNLPATSMKRIDNILIPVNTETYLFPYSDTNAVLGFLTDGSEVLVHIIDMTSRTINSDILKSITSPRNSHYFLVKYRTFAFESGRCYVAMNLPEYSLSEYLSILKSDSRSDPMVVNKLAWQFLKGLSSIHEGLGLQHGNMMPSNIVVDVEGKLMLSEYSFLQPETAKAKFMGLIAVEHDRACWSPTEVITETEPYSMKSDIQVAGMILHYILSGGHHPYGEINLEIQVSLQQNWPKMTYISDEVNGLINDMLVMPQSTRPSMEQILKHPYFWANEKRLRFVLIAGSDVLRDMKSGTSTTGGAGWTMIDIINNACRNAMFCEWTSVVDLVVLKEMRSFRQYKNTLVELVLFVYNCCLHYDKLSQTARDIIDEPCKYFLTTFPSLFMSVYTAIKSSCRVERACYKPFF